MVWIDLARDVRFTFRTFGRNAGFFAVSALILGLGIGANSAIFSVINPLLLRPLPFPEPERLVWIANTGKKGGLSTVTSRTSNLRDYRRLNRSFDGLTGYNAFFDYSSYTLVGDNDPERLVGVGVAQNFLDVLGVQPRVGRNFVDEECIWEGRRAVILTHTFWERRFGARADVLGRAITINDQPNAVVGVLPAWFDFGSIFSPGSRVDFLIPFPITDETDRRGNTLVIIGRLAPGATIQTAQAELDLINQQLKEADPARWGLGAVVTNLQEKITGRFRGALTALACAVGVVLLIACANLSNMLLARSAGRQQEIAVRRAMGASRARLVRQMLTENLLLAGCGAVLGLLIAYAATRAVAGTDAFSIPLLQSVELDASALFFTLIVAVGTGLLFGIVPALQISGAQGYDALRESARGLSEGKSRSLIREALVVSEVALACILLVGAGLLLRSFLTLLNVELGFRPEQAMAWRIETNRGDTSLSERAAFYGRLVRNIETVPGIESIGLTDALPLGRNRSWGLRVKGEVYPDGQNPGAFPRMVDSGYIETMRIPLIAGRNFTADDTLERQGVMIINEAMARELWPGRDPIGQVVITVGTEWQVVGVVGDVRHASLEEQAGLEMYMPITQQPDWGSLELVIRSKLPPESLVAGVREALRAVDPTLPTGEFRTLGQMVAQSVSPRRFVMLLLGAFALTALLLASLGIYGVLSYSVTQRAQEIGIRMALGASATQVQVKVVMKTVVLASVGILVGLLGSLILSKLMASLLYGVSPTDPTTLLMMIVFLLLVSCFAGFLPARRASQIDPMAVLRST